MPSDDFWSASMLLRWVLTRDEDAVERMLRQYSDIIIGMPVITIQIQDQDNNVIGEHDIQIAGDQQRAKTWSDVISAHELVPPVPRTTKHRELVSAFIRSMDLTKATQLIYSALQRGTLEGCARRNGSGDVERIAPVQWTRLRFLGIDGHDIAVPTGANGEPLPLLRPMTDYLSGTVSSTQKPTVWVDPEFSTAQVMNLWPPVRPGQENSGVQQQELTDDVLFRTGAPGRPTSMHLIEAEFERRQSGSELKPSLAMEAEFLHRWLKTTYPGAPSASPRTIEGKIRAQYRIWKASQEAHKND
jgi:hypothetical protein